MSDIERDEAVERLLHPLRRQRPRFEPERQAAVWAAIEGELHRPAAWPRLAVAAVVLVGVGFAAWSMADRAGMGAESRTPDAPIARQPITERVVDESLTLPSGATIDVQGEAHIASATADLTRIELKRGRVTTAVPPLGDRRLIVATPLAEIEVRGTRFEVAMSEDTTTVMVTEGEVAVRVPDNRQDFTLGAGEWAIIEPTTEAGATRAAARSDHAQALDIRRALAERLGDDLTRRNAVLRLGHAADAQAPAFAPALWARAVERHPTGMHADEFAFRHAAALRQIGRLDAARAAAKRFRARFPDSPRAAETRAW